MENKEEIYPIYKLKELTTIKRGSSPRPINDYMSNEVEGLPWLKISDFSMHDRYVFKTHEFLKKSGLKKTRYVKKGTLICTNSATPGIPIFLGKDMCLHDGFLYFETISNKLDSLYLYYFIIANRNKIVGLGNGSIFVNLKKEIMENYEIELPPLATQRKIASILSAIDDKIELNNRMNENLMNQTLARYKDIFLNIGDRKVCAASQFFDITIGKTPPRKETQWFTKDINDVRWASISDMGNCGVYISDTNERLTHEAIDKYNVVLIPDNTIILSFKLTVGRIAISNGTMATNEAIAHFKTEKKEYIPYLYCYLKCFKYDELGSTSSIATAVNSKIIKAMPFVIPNENELYDFNKTALVNFEIIKNNEKENKRLAELRDTLLPKLMSGEIDVDAIEL